MTGRYQLVVYGKPEPGGSKRHVGGGRIIDDNPNVAGWKQLVGYEALAQRDGRPMLEGPLKLTLLFFVQRPQSHYGTGRNQGQLKPSAPTFPTTRPDVTKLTRAVEDAMTGVLYHDDAQIVQQSVKRRYAQRDQPACVHIQVETLPFDNWAIE